MQPTSNKSLQGLAFLINFKWHELREIACSDRIKKVGAVHCFIWINYKKSTWS